MIIDELRAHFNEATGSVRLITFLSPTCGPCRYGQGVVRALFEEFPDVGLTGFVIWVPMLPPDSPGTAQSEQDAIADPRFRFWFDHGRKAALAWSSFIGLPAPTWDVYAVYDGEASWSGAAPPAPRIWMHQLNPTPATRPEVQLDPGRLAREWLAVIGRGERGASELALKLHASGQAVSVRGEPPA
ncbi:MAG: hypothetical protein WEC75_03990 [Dehalococcoidia bacterium]